MRHDLSASSLHRVALCAASAVLPQVRVVTDASTRGTAIHKYLEAVSRGAKPEVALEAVPPEHRTVCEAIDLNSVPACDPATYRSEVALAWDSETGWARELGEGLGRDYSGLDPTEIPGTADVLGLSTDSVFVGDYKSGFRTVPPARENLQLRFLALAACRAHERSRAVVAIIRLREDGSAWYDQAELSEADLEDTAREVRELLAQVERTGESVFAGEVPPVTAGEHCAHCPAKTHCPAYTQMLSVLASYPDEVTEAIRSRLTPELASTAYQRLKLAEEALEMAKKALQASWFEEAARSLALLRRDAVIPFLRALRGFEQTTREHILEIVERYMKRDDATARALAEGQGLPPPKLPAPSPDDCKQAIELG